MIQRKDIGMGISQDEPQLVAQGLHLGKVVSVVFVDVEDGVEHSAYGAQLELGVLVAVDVDVGRVTL